MKVTYKIKILDINSPYFIPSPVGTSLYEARCLQAKGSINKHVFTKNIKALLGFSAPL